MPVQCKFNRRHFLRLGVATALSSFASITTPCLASDNLSGTVQAVQQMPIVTSRALLTENGDRRFDVKNRLTKHNFNLVSNAIGISPNERHIISAREALISDANTVNIFVHGFNTGWIEGIKLSETLFKSIKTNNINQLNFLYSWRSNTAMEFPKNAGLFERLKSLSNIPDWGAQYISDLRKVSADATILSNFIVFLKRTYPELSINLVAYSLGAKICLEAITHAASRLKPNKNLISQLIWLSPDVTNGEFAAAASDIFNACGRVTVYTSPKDLALWVANYATNGSRFRQQRRLGVPNFEASIIYSYRYIDYLAYNQRNNEYSHSFFLHDKLLLADLRALLALPKGGSIPMAQRPIAKNKRVIQSGMHHNIYKMYPSR